MVESDQRNVAPWDKWHFNVIISHFKTRFCSGLESCVHQSAFTCAGLIQTELIIQGFAQYLAAPSFSRCVDDPHVHPTAVSRACVRYTYAGNYSQKNKWGGGHWMERWKVCLNWHCISPQSAYMVVIQTMVNMLARANQEIFHLLLLQRIHHPWTVLYTLTVVLGSNHPLCV